MNFPKELTIVTPLSKYLAVAVFVTLPIVGFFLGIRYQEMMGLAKRQEMEANVTITRTPTPTPIPIPTVDPSITANWQTYRNEEWGFEVKYPSTWNVHENNNFVSLIPPYTKEHDPTGEVGIMIEKNPHLVEIDSDAKKEFKAFQDLCSLETSTSCDEKVSDDYRFEKEITVGGNLAFQTYGGCCMDIGRHIFVYNKNNRYRITLYYFNADSTTLKNEDVFNQILSTFRFVP